MVFVDEKCKCMLGWKGLHLQMFIGRQLGREEKEVLRCEAGMWKEGGNTLHTHIIEGDTDK